MRIPRSRAGAVLALTAATAAGLATAAQPAAADTCSTGIICRYYNTGCTGYQWNWSTLNGLQNVPAKLHDHAYSVKIRGICAIGLNYHGSQPAEVNNIRPDDDSNWDFGHRIDAIRPIAC